MIGKPTVILILILIIIWLLIHLADAQEIHFSNKEFACRCCGQAIVDPGLIRRLEDLRAHFGREIIVTSGYRCPRHNRKCGGARHSQHVLGKAADIKIRGIVPAQVARIARQCGFTFIRTYKSWTHVDVREK
jgi:hypothetical protein